MLETSIAQVSGAKAIAASTVFPIALIAVGGFIIWQQWRNRQDMAELRVAIKDEQQLEQRLDVLLKEQRELSERISRLHEQQVERQPQRLNVQALTNEAAKPAQTVSKMAMLKRLIDDNVDLREKLRQ